MQCNHDFRVYNWSFQSYSLIELWVQNRMPTEGNEEEESNEEEEEGERMEDDEEDEEDDEGVEEMVGQVDGGGPRPFILSLI